MKSIEIINRIIKSDKTKFVIGLEDDKTKIEAIEFLSNEENMHKENYNFFSDKGETMLIFSFK